MRAIIFTKVDSETWEARPFQGWHYRIITRWLKGYTLYFNGEYVASEARLKQLKSTAKEHMALSYHKTGQ